MAGKGFGSGDVLRDLIGRHKGGASVGVYSVCSAHPSVLRACMMQARADGTPLLIEATSNQVNQYGGYTGMKPADFVAFVNGLAAEADFPPERIILGGDHLGPNAWRNKRAAEAMAEAAEMVRDYVTAGFAKIHLDASMHCADDPGDRHAPLADEIVAARAAELCRVAEEAFFAPGTAATAPLYAIGTEVPIPGGAEETAGAPAVTKAADVRRTIEVAREAFLARGLAAAWDRVIAVVVQPGVEFGDDWVADYDHGKTREISSLIEGYANLVYEAHSTDYQTEAALRGMVADHFAILKVGPWLTNAFREAVFALEWMEGESYAGRTDLAPSGLRDALEKEMLANPVHWRNHYRGSDDYLAYARKYSYSDRSRYYWVQPPNPGGLGPLVGEPHPPPAPLDAAAPVHALTVPRRQGTGDRQYPGGIGASLHPRRSRVRLCQGLRTGPQSRIATCRPPRIDRAGTRPPGHPCHPQSKVTKSKVESLPTLPLAFSLFPVHLPSPIPYSLVPLSPLLPFSSTPPLSLLPPPAPPTATCSCRR